MEFYNYKAHISRVIDGDTVVAIIDAGFDMTLVKHLRLLGINAPELHASDPAIREQAVAAKTYLSGLLTGQDVVITTQKDDAFGRYLAIVYLGTLNVNQDMLDKGFAVTFK